MSWAFTGASPAETHIFKLLAGEDVESDKVDLGVTVLASLGGRHVDDLKDSRGKVQ